MIGDAHFCNLSQIKGEIKIEILAMCLEIRSSIIWKCQLTIEVSLESEMQIRSFIEKISTPNIPWSHTKVLKFISINTQLFFSVNQITLYIRKPVLPSSSTVPGKRERFNRPSVFLSRTKDKQNEKLEKQQVITKHF